MLRPAWGGRPTGHHVKLVPMALPNQGRNFTARDPGYVIWGAMCDHYHLPSQARYTGEGTRFPLNDDGHRDTGGNSNSQGMGQGKGQWPSLPNPEVQHLVSQWQGVRERARLLGVTAADWAYHVHHTYGGDVYTATADLLWLDLARRDPLLEAARNLQIVDDWLHEHGYPNGDGPVDLASLPVANGFAGTGTTEALQPDTAAPMASTWHLAQDPVAAASAAALQPGIEPTAALHPGLVAAPTHSLVANDLFMVAATAAGSSGHGPAAGPFANPVAWPPVK